MSIIILKQRDGLDYYLRTDSVVLGHYWDKQTVQACCAKATPAFTGSDQRRCIERLYQHEKHSYSASHQTPEIGLMNASRSKLKYSMILYK